MSHLLGPTCAQCGSLNCRLVEKASKVGFLCPACLSVAEAKFAEFQRQFQELLDLGVNRALANEVMIDRSDRYHAARDEERKRAASK